MNPPGRFAGGRITSALWSEINLSNVFRVQCCVLADQLPVLRLNEVGLLLLNGILELAVAVKICAASTLFVVKI